MAPVVATLRIIGEAERPSDLAFEAFSNFGGVDEMSYAAAELGVPHAWSSDARRCGGDALP